MEKKNKESLKTEWQKFHNLINTILYICGFKNIWISDLKLPEKFVNIYDKVLILGHPLLISSMITFFIAAFKANNLTPLQSADLTHITISLPVVYYNFYTFLYYKAEVRDILHDLFLVLKINHIDSQVQLRRIKRMKVYLAIIMSIPCIGILQRTGLSIFKIIANEGVFNPLPIIWPDQDDKSAVGYVARVLNYILVWWFIARLNGVNGLILLLLLSCSHQFEDLQSYFQNLGEIFKDDSVRQKEKERRYEDGFKKGIHVHVLTLRCMHRCQHVCRTIFSIQLLQLFGGLITIMIPVIDSSSFVMKVSSGLIFLFMLANLAVLMCSSGNITFEAERVADAMYASGWQNCYRASSVRVRKLVFIGMVNAQQPLVFKAFGFMEMSYQNFVTIVKTAYSIFSVFFSSSSS